MEQKLLPLTGKKIVLGVTGGIAVYKAVEVASRLKKAGAEVHVVMTKHATEFVTELTFREISGQPVSVDMFAPVAHFKVEHVALARMADLVLIAPATANIIAKLAVGLADDMLSTTVLATKAPVFLAPAMNTNMYENPVTQANLTALSERGMHVIEPDSGPLLAYGVVGKGRFPEPQAVVQHVLDFFAQTQDLLGKKVIVSAGGTIEPIDPVRYLGNRSTGKMGYAVAQEAARRGAEVTLVAGHTMLADPADAKIKLVRVQSARDMQRAIEAEYEAADAVIMSAAVADYRPQRVSPQKIKKSDDDLVLRLVRNPDILYGLGQNKTHQLLVGFAAETQDVEEYAWEKLQHKNLDFIVANNVSQKDAGFAVDTNRAKIFTRDGQGWDYPLMTKQKLAKIIIDKLAERWQQAKPTKE